MPPSIAEQAQSLGAQLMETLAGVFPTGDLTLTVEEQSENQARFS